MNLFLFLSIQILYLWIAWQDGKDRQVSLLLLSLLAFLSLLEPRPLSLRLMGLLPFFLALFLGRKTGLRSGGADLKLYAIVGMGEGYAFFLLSLILSCLLLLPVTVVLHRPWRRTIPMCTYLGISTVLLRTFFFITGGIP